MDLFTLIATISLSTAGFKNGLKDASESMQSFGDRVSSIASAAGKAVEAGLTIASGAAIAFAKNSVDVGKQFDAAMANVSAISGATGKALDDLRETAIAMGGSTRFSATEAADALGYMAMAGWEPQQMMDGLKGVMDLAAASGEGLARVSDIVTDALTAFGLGAEDSAHFADVLAVASSAANTNVSMMGETFKYVAPLAGTLGYKIEDMAVSIGLMANAGIKASQAGTSLRAGLSKLVKPTNDAISKLKELGLTVQDMSDEEIAAKTAALEQSVTAREKAYSDEEEALQDSLDRQYDALKKSLDARYNATKDTYDSEYDALKKALDKQYDAQKEAFDGEYDERKKALDKSYEAAKDTYDRQYDERKKALDAEYEALEKTLDDEIDAFQRAQEEELAQVQKSQEEQVKKYEAAAESKIASIDEVYKQSLKNTDEEEYRRLQELDDQIAAIEAQSEAAREAAERDEREQRRAELRKAINTADSAEKRREAEQKLADYNEKIRQKDAEAKRKADIANLKAQKDAVKEQAKAERDAAKETRDADIKNAKAESAAELEVIKERNKAELDELKRGQKDALKEQKDARAEQLDAAKEANAQELKELKQLNEWRLSTIKELNNSELDALKKSHAEQLNALKESNDNQLKDLKKAQSDQLSAIKDGNEEKLKEAKKGYARQLSDLKDAHKAQLKEYQDSVKQQTAELKKQGEARAAVLTDENGKTRSFIEVVETLREKFKGLTEAEQSEYAATIFGQEAMSGWLAIINASEDDFNDLREQINVASAGADKFAEAMENNGFSADAMRASMSLLGVTQKEFDKALEDSKGNVDDFRKKLLAAADGGTTLDDIDNNLTISGQELTKVFGEMSAAAQMAGTHEDSLAGSVTTLGSALETLRIRIADKLNPTIREFTEFGQESVVALTGAFEREDAINGLSSAIRDAEGNLLSAGKIAGVLSDTLYSMSESDRQIAIKEIFGTDDMEYVNSLLDENGGKWDELLGHVSQIDAVAATSSGLSGMMDALAPIITEGIGKILEYLPDVVTVGGQILGAVVTGIINNLPLLWDGALKVASAFIGYLHDAFRDAFENFGLGEQFDAISESVSATFEKVRDAVTGAFERIKTALSNAFGEYFTSGQAAQDVTELLTGAIELFGDAVSVAADFVATAVEKIVDFVKWLSEGSTGADLLTAAVSGVVGAFVVFKTALAISALIDTVTKAFAGLNAIMAANPLILVATLIGGVVAALIVLWNTNEDFRNAVINIGNTISDFVTGLVDVIVNFFTQTIPNALAALREFVSAKTEEIKNFFIGLRDGIMEAFANIGAWFSDKFTAAYNAATEAWSGVTQWASDRWTDISNAFNGAKDWFSEKFSSAWDAVTGAFGGVKAFFESVWNDITGVFSGAFDWFKNIGKNIVDGMREGIGGLWDGFLTFIGAKTDDVKEEVAGPDGFDTHSPSKWARKVFRGIPEGGILGFNDGMPGLLSSAGSAVRDIQDALSVDPFNVSGGYSFAAAPQLAAATAGATYGRGQAANPVPVNFTVVNELEAGGVKLERRQVQYRVSEDKRRGASLVKL